MSQGNIYTHKNFIILTYIMLKVAALENKMFFHINFIIHSDYYREFYIMSDYWRHMCVHAFLQAIPAGVTT